MPNGLTLLQLVIAALTLALGGEAGVMLGGERPLGWLAAADQAAGSGSQPRLLAVTEPDPLLSPALLSAGPAESGPLLAIPAAQADPVEPLDTPVADDETLDAPIQVPPEPLDAPLAEDEALDAALDEAEVLDAPVVDVEILDAPLDDSIAVRPPPEVEPLDAPVAAEVIDRPLAEFEPLDAAPVATEVAAVPVAKPIAAAPVAKPVAVAPIAKPAAAPVAVAPDPKKAAPLPDEGKKMVTSVRAKHAPASQVAVTSGASTIPAELAGCGVAVAAGRATVGSDCPDSAVVVAYQPAIRRVPGSAALISAENPSLITSRRDGVQIGEYPAPTLGGSIATAVRAAIFPADVVVPEVLIVPGEVVVAGNDSREDPIVLWRSELEQAAAETGMPVEILATAIRLTSNGEPASQSATGGVGLLNVPVAELIARGVPRDEWYDPATNIRVGAEVLAAVAAESQSPPAAALTAYLADSCEAAAACGQVAPQIQDWITHYRLRMTNDAADIVIAPAADPVAVISQTGDVPNWPFTEDSAAAAATVPFDLTGYPFGDDEPAATRPSARVGGQDDQEQPETEAPASRVRVNRE